MAHSLAFGARIFQDKHNAPVVSMHLAPSAFRTMHLQPSGIAGKDTSGWPVPLKRLMWWAIDRLLLDRRIEPTVNAFRAELGLPAISHPFKDWLHSPDRTIGLFPPWFGPAQPDWPEQARLTGFPLFDETGQHDLDPELERFLDNGPPIAFTPGSAHLHGTEFFATAIEATAKLGRAARLSVVASGLLMRLAVCSRKVLPDRSWVSPPSRYVSATRLPMKLHHPTKRSKPR